MSVRIINADVLEGLAQLDDSSVHCVVTSPPYWGLRDYGIEGQIGLEPTPEAYVQKMVEVFREVRRVLRKDGTCWLNLGDSYAGGGRSGGSENCKQRTNVGSLVPPSPLGDCKPKDLVGIPWRVAFALQADGWWLRQDIIWSKPNPMPESVTDRCTKAHEYIFLLTKAKRYYYDAEAIAEPASYPEGPGNIRPIKGAGMPYFETCGGFGKGPMPSETRNKRSVWEVTTQPYSEAHFATFPLALIEPCIKAGCPQRGIVLDPFGGAGTTGLVADRLERDAVLIELNPDYAAMARRRIEGDCPLFTNVAV